MDRKRGSTRTTSRNSEAVGDVSPSKRSRLAPRSQKSTKAPNAKGRRAALPKATPVVNPGDKSESLGQLVPTKPEDLLASLLAPAVSVATFFDRHWEREPLVVHRGGDAGPSASYYGSVFSKDGLMGLLAKHDIQFGQDINICRYVESNRENLNGRGRATLAKVKSLFDKKKATLQFHQPQRFQDGLWQICELLESYFHSLVGANVYITPGGSQGLAPHYDDVEVFILQLEGRKHWHLYSPPTELPRDYSRDLSQDDIGQPTHDFVLETGDLLYFPRGTVHQADTPADCPYSTHVTISTYQRSSNGDLLALALPNILNSAVDENVDFRKGLKVDQLMNSTASEKSVFEYLLGQLTNHISDHINKAKYLMLKDFVANRLPPYIQDGCQTSPLGPMPKGSCKVRLAHPRHTFVHEVSKCEDDEDINNEDEDEEDENSEDTTADANNDIKDGERLISFIVVQHSLANSRTTHMMDSCRTKPAALRFPTSHLKALHQLISCKEHDWLESGQLCLSEADVWDFLVALWSEGLVEVSKE
ncbi:ribosomal oxygenase 2-like [Acanthaster planci]|uniref:Bifunctional lysine-specific demethylase and histidyl-hydroxylase n=1 Tax=Acanthaster planci TaxID=133434 RepID=A0A8B7YQT4_ACAPL|nr:ribosomal oxygenase 2-like [Acanthaster planci]